MSSHYHLIKISHSTPQLPQHPAPYVQSIPLGTLCEALLMVEAFKGTLICPNKQVDPLEEFHEVRAYVRTYLCACIVKCVYVRVYMVMYFEVRVWMCGCACLVCDAFERRSVGEWGRVYELERVCECTCCPPFACYVVLSFFVWRHISVE